MSVHVIILAAGESKRMGIPKGHVRLPDGRTLLEHQMERLAGKRVTLVVGATRYEADARIVINPHPENGPFSSLQCALDDEAAFVLPIDVPCADVFMQLQTGVAAIPTYQGKGGHPVWLSAPLSRKLRTLSPTDRLDRILHTEPGVVRVPVDAPEIVMNLNAPADLAAAFPSLRPPSK